MTRRHGRLVWALSVMAALAAITTAWPHWREARGLRRLLASTVSAEGRHIVDCRALRADKPLVLLALGQSNAGNHGVARPGGGELRLVTPEGCVITHDPLPGATGQGGSLWSHLPAALQARGIERPLVLGLLALDGLHAQPWVEAGSPVRARLLALLQAMREQGLAPQFVLWQQGEADARRGTPPAAWQEALRDLATLLAEQGLSPPVLLARSTICRSAPDTGLRDAAAGLVTTDARFRLGADTDSLQGSTMRYDGCHFSVEGLSAAAGLWADQLAIEAAIQR